MSDMSEIPSGSLGNLSLSQEEKLREFWKMLLQSWEETAASADIAAKSSVASAGAAKTHRRFFSLGGSQSAAADEVSAIPQQMLSSLKSLGAGSNELKAIQSLLTRLHGEKLRAAYLSILKQDHPDALLLRYLRAEKWDVPKSWIKFVRTLNWRVNEYHVEEVLRQGEEYALAQSRDAENSVEKRDGESFVLQLRTGKGHFHGVDRCGRPICVIRVRLHNPNEQTTKALNDYVVHCIETARIMLVPPVETITVVFDLTSFTLSNWDFPPVKFIIENFQENYPESLGALVFYNAPWIFSGFWKLIRTVLDPVVAAKVHFLSGVKGLEQLIPREHIIKELGGDEDWEYYYMEPKLHENDKLQDTETRDIILEDRKKLGDDLFSLTSEWIADSQADYLTSRRSEVIKQLRDNYWTLDPYVRARTILDRTGVIKGGNVDFYAEAESQPEEVQIQSSEEAKVMVEHLDDTQLTAVGS